MSRPARGRGAAVGRERSSVGPKCRGWPHPDPLCRNLRFSKTPPDPMRSCEFEKRQAVCGGKSVFCRPQDVIVAQARASPAGKSGKPEESRLLGFM